jgi:hypothetical protein
MKPYDASYLVLLLALVVNSPLAFAVELIERATDQGTVVGYQDTPLLPWTGNKYHVHDPDRPLPKVVLPRPLQDPLPAAPLPSDATLLLGGDTLDQWEPSTWQMVDGVAVAGKESLVTRNAYGDCQLHLEFAAPVEPSENFMNRGNSGVILMGKYELQIFDSWHEHGQQIYPDGQCASIYGQTPPLVNACLPPGAWQSFDILFRAPVFEGEKLQRPAFLTVYHNGVLVHDHQAIMGEMMHRDIAPYQPHPAKLPLVLQGHGAPVQFRNVWIRELP